MTKTILLVDDDPVIRRILDVGLTEKGFTVLVAENGQEALDKVSKHRPDLVVTDAMMPKMDGFTFCRQLRLQAASGQLPVIILSAKTALEDVRTGYQAGVDAYLKKPVSLQELCDTIQQLLNPLTS